MGQFYTSNCMYSALINYVVTHASETNVHYLLIRILTNSGIVWAFSMFFSQSVKLSTPPKPPFLSRISISISSYNIKYTTIKFFKPLLTLPNINSNNAGVYTSHIVLNKCTCLIKCTQVLSDGIFPLK